MRQRFVVVALLLPFAVAPFTNHSTAADANPAKPLVFAKDVQPIFRAHCLQCHNADKHKGDLSLETAADLLKGGASGPALVPAMSASSLLWQKVSKDKMPPGRDKLSTAEKDTLKELD